MKMKKLWITLLLAVTLICLTAGAAGAEGEKIGIIGAMDMEVDSLKQAADITAVTEIAGMAFCEGTLGDKKVVIVKCGIGKVNAGICAHTLITQFGCTAVINTGVAGSLDNRIDIGDIVVSVDAVQHDFDATPVGYAKGEIPDIGITAFPADESLRRAAVDAVRECAPEIQAFEGRVCTGDQFAEEEMKDRLAGEFDGMCCDMEGAAIAQACWLNQVPFVIIRAISDKKDGSASADYNTFAAAAAAHCAEIVRYMVERY